MKTLRIFEKMRATENNRLESFNKAYAARTNSERDRHALEGKRYSNEWMMLLGLVDAAVSRDKREVR